MKIIIIPNEPNPNMTGRHYGIAKSLAAQGHEVHTVMWDLPQLQSGAKRFTHLYQSMTTREYDYEDLKLHKIRRLPYFWPVINGWLFGSQLRKLFRKLDADIIFAMSYTNETTIPKDLPLIYDLADDYYAPADVFGSPVYKIMFAVLGVKRTMRRHASQALAVTAVSDLLCDYAKTYNSNVIKLPNGVETKLIKTSLKKAAKAKSNPHSLAYVTGFGPWSRPLEIMQAVTKLRKTFPDIKLSLVGEGSEVPAIKQYIIDNQAEGYIHYLGFIHNRQAVFDIIAHHAIGLNISEKNAWRDAAHPMKVIEYSALGKRVVSTNLVGVTSLAEQGFTNIHEFSDTKPAQSLEKVLRKALSDPFRPNQYNAISQTVLQDYDWQNLAKQLVTTVQSALVVKQQLHVVHVTPSYPPTLGGLEKVAQVLAATQAKLGMPVSVITARPAADMPPIEDTVPVTRLSRFVIANTTIMPQLFGKLLSLPEHSLVHLHITQAFTPEVVWLASKFHKFPYVAHVHLDVPASGPAGVLLEFYKSLFLKRVLKHAKRVIVPTKDYEALVIRKYRIPKAQISIVPNATDHVVLSASKKYPSGTIHLLFVGRLSPQKNIPLLLAALSYYAANYTRRFQLTIVGDGELKNALKNKVKHLGLDAHVSFAGSLSGNALENAYKSADIFLLTSIAESFGLVLVEAMTKGLPIVTTDIPAVRNVVRNKKNGFLVKEKPADLAIAIERIASDRSVYEQLSANNLKEAQLYRWSKVNEQIMRIYGDVV